MEEEEGEPRQIFVYKKDSMQFAIILEHLLMIEVHRVLKYIDEQGGEFMGFDPEDNKYINLASAKYKGPDHQIIFDIKYVKSCVKENRLMDLNAYQIGGPRCNPCMPLKNMLEINRCPHYKTPEEILNILMKKILV